MNEVQSSPQWVKLNLILSLFAALLALLMLPQQVSAGELSQGWRMICTDHRHTMRGWICVEYSTEVELIAMYPFPRDRVQGQEQEPTQDQPAASFDEKPGRKPEPGLADLPYHYLQVHDARVPLYQTLDDAVAGINPRRHLIPGFDYVSFDSQVNVDGEWYYHTSLDFWMSGRQAAYLGRMSSFQGLVFDHAPRTDFGWVLSEVESQQIQSEGEPVSSGRLYQRYDVVRILEESSFGGTEYLRVAEREWLPASSVAGVHRREGRPEGVKKERWIDVNLAQQTLAVYEGGEIVFATLVSSGVEGNWTRPGTFRIDTKKETELMRGAFAPDKSDYYYLENVPWTMYFDEARALHGTYWHDDFGRPQSKGCVNLSPGDAHWLFKWAEEGDVVHVYDPSGETPTDPDLFHSGGA